MDQDLDEAIKARAYQLWEESGHAHGRHDEHWRQAERDLRGTPLNGAAEATAAPLEHADGISPLPAQEQVPDSRRQVPGKIIDP